MKFIKIFLVSLLVVAAVAFLYLRIRKSNDFEPQIKKKLAEMVSAASNGLYKLDVEHIEIDITSASINAKNILLLPDSARMLVLEQAGVLGNDVYTISLKKLDLDGVSAIAFLNDKEIKLGKLVLDSPEIKIFHKQRNAVKKDTASLYENVSKINQSVSIESLLLQNIRLVFTNTDKKKTVSSFQNLSASFTDIKIDSSTINDSTRFLFAKDAVVFLKGFKQTTAKQNYTFSIDSVALKPQRGILDFFELRLKPKGTRDAFNARQQFMSDQYDISIKKGTVKNINWFSLLSDEGFFGDELTLDGGFLKVYDDRRLPQGPPKKNNFPHQKILAVAFPISMKKIMLNSMDVIYEELNPASERTGMVEFYNVDGTISNVTNIKEEIKTNPMMTITASADFMNAAKLDAVFTFDLVNAAKGIFTVEAALGPMDGKKLNKITEALALVKINTLDVDKLKFKMKGSNTQGSGNLMLAYHNLSFDVLKNDNDKDVLKKRGLLSFIADKIIVKNANPKKEGGEIKQFDVIHQHDPARSFFNLIWKTMLAGIMKTVK